MERDARLQSKIQNNTGRLAVPTISRIRIYPIKSLDGMDLRSSEVLPNGALSNDRRFQLVDEQGQIINGKRVPALHQIRCEYDQHVSSVCLRIPNDSRRITFSLASELEELALWLSEFLKCRIHIEENCSGGFPDDPQASGPTVVSRASLVEVASWFDGLDEQQVRLRMRANLELGDCVAFWEDQLFKAADEVVFRIGNVIFAGTNPCARCVVPSRDPYTGEHTGSFQTIFSEARSTKLPAWAARERFDHFYRFAANTRGLAAGTIRVGDPVFVSESR